MKITLATAAASLFLFTVATSAAWADAPQVGIGLHTGGGLGATPNSLELAGGLGGIGGLGALGSLSTQPGGAITVPINVAPSFRLEPIFGFSYYQQEVETDDDPNDSITLPAKTTRTNTSLTAGLGIYHLTKLTSRTLMHAGGRLGVGRASAVTEIDGATTDTSRMGYSAGGVMGAEYMLSPRLGLGGEVALTGTYLGDSSVEGDGSDGLDHKDTALRIDTGIAFRLTWYLL